MRAINFGRQFSQKKAHKKKGPLARAFLLNG